MFLKTSVISLVRHLQFAGAVPVSSASASTPLASTPALPFMANDAHGGSFGAQLQSFEATLPALPARETESASALPAARLNPWTMGTSIATLIVPQPAKGSLIRGESDQNTETSRLLVHPPPQRSPGVPRRHCPRHCPRPFPRLLLPKCRPPLRGPRFCQPSLIPVALCQPGRFRPTLRRPTLS